MGDPEKSVQLHDDAPKPAEASVSVDRELTAEREPGEPIWARIRRHKVVEWTLAYVAFGYALLHGVQMLRETFEWPLIVPRLTVFGLVLGTPVAVTLSWYHGHRARQRVSGPELSILIALLVLAGSVLWWLSRHSRERITTPTAVASATPNLASAAAPFNPPAHSIAVLPFVNLSGDKEQEYFSDGLTEELLNSISEINGLQVAARTSSFSFKEHPDIVDVAHKLNVASVLEGSVRRSAHTVRVTAQLIDAVTGFHQWSKTYDRDLGDVLRLQTEIAAAVASALKVTLLGDLSARIELGGTHDPAAFDAYLRALKALTTAYDSNNYQVAIAAFTEAIRSDPNYALAFAGRAIALCGYARSATGPALRDSFDKAQADARRALALTPDLAEGHLALARFAQGGSFDFRLAQEEYARALALAPGNAQALSEYGRFLAFMGRGDAAISAARHAVVLDPLNASTHAQLGLTLYYARHYDPALAAYQEALALDPDFQVAYGFGGLSYYLLGNLQDAHRTCKTRPEHFLSRVCLALTYDKLGRRADAEAALAGLMATNGDAAAFQYAEIYAQWGNTLKALGWLDTAMRARDTGMTLVKVDPLMDPLRNEPRFQAIERALKFLD
jgi:TolB-like protein/Tfp pilus assembly protein PilF